MLGRGGGLHQSMELAFPFVSFSDDKRVLDVEQQTSVHAYH